MSNRELPMMPWFPDQFDAATKGWSFIERAAYRALLDAQWQLGSLPQEQNRLSLTIGMRARDFGRVWPRMEEKFPISNGTRKNFRLEQHRLAALALKNAKSDGARKANAKRWHSDSETESDTDRSAIRQRSPPSPSPSPSLEEEEHPLPPQGGGHGLKANGRAERDRSLSGWRSIGGLTDYVRDSDPPLTWAYVAEHCPDPVALRAAEKIGYRVIADRDKFTTKDIQARFREAYESELERASA